MIDFKKLDRADLWIASEKPTPEDDKAFSAFLKKLRAKQAAAQARSKKGHPAAPARKKARAK